MPCLALRYCTCWASCEGRTGHGPEAEGRGDPALKREVAGWRGVVEYDRGGGEEEGDEEQDDNDKERRR